MKRPKIIQDIAIHGIVETVIIDVASHSAKKWITTEAPKYGILRHMSYIKGPVVINRYEYQIIHNFNVNEVVKWLTSPQEAD